MNPHAPCAFFCSLSSVVIRRQRGWTAADMLANIAELQAALLKQGQPLEWQL